MKENLLWLKSQSLLKLSITVHLFMLCLKRIVLGCTNVNQLNHSAFVKLVVFEIYMYIYIYWFIYVYIYIYKYASDNYMQSGEHV
jgi:hypothetical protein